MGSVDELWSVHLGRIAYADALDLQERLRDARRADRVPDTVLWLEHPPVYTRGRRSEPGELPLGEAFYAARGIDVVDVRRGGKVTYHGPGQLVGYPVMRVGSTLAFVGALERAIVAALADEGLTADAGSGDGVERIGVWTGGRKIASIGVHVHRHVSTHGLAVNVTNDLEPFGWIVPCGLDAVRMTSIAAERGGADLGCFRKRLAHRLAAELGRRQRLITPAHLEAALARDPAPVG